MSPCKRACVRVLSYVRVCRLVLNTVVCVRFHLCKRMYTCTKRGCVCAFSSVRAYVDLRVCVGLSTTAEHVLAFSVNARIKSSRPGLYHNARTHKQTNLTQNRSIFILMFVWLTGYHYPDQHPRRHEQCRQRKSCNSLMHFTTNI